MRISVGLKLGLWLAVMMTLSSGAVGYYVYQQSQRLVVDSSKDELLTATRVLAHSFSDALAAITSDIKLLDTLPLTHRILAENPSNGDIDQDKQHLAELFSSLLVSRPEYSQIRLIDALHYGKELVRVDRTYNGIQNVAAAQLQEKSHFPYVYETVHLKNLYISEINLNQELGAHLGFGKPTIRIATPIAHPDGRIAGVAVINVDLDNLFKRLRANLPRDIKVLLTNSRGDYLIHPDPRKTFAFEHGQQYLLQTDIPSTTAILSGEYEQTVLDVDASALPDTPAVAAFVRMHLGGNAEAQTTIMLGLYTSLDSILTESRVLGRRISEATLLIGLIAIALSLLLARILTQPLNAMTKLVSEFEPGKSLSNLPSGRNDEIGYLAGSFANLAIKLNLQIDQLHSSEARLQGILDNLPLGIWLIGARSRFLNKTFRDNLSLSDQAFFEDPRFSHLLEPRQTACGDVEQAHFLFADGAEHQLEIHKIQLPEQSALIGIAIDITERKHAEKILRSSEEKLRSMFEMSPLGISQNSMDGRYIEVNKALLDMVGYSLEEINRMDYWQLTPKEYAADEQLQLQSLAETGKYGPYEKEYIHRDGHRVPIRLNGVLINDSDSNQYIWSIVEDITKRKASELMIWQQANFDPLTLLPNRSMFHDRLELDIKKAHRSGRPLVLIFLDLDRFKEVNDTLGHDMGDLLLKEAAQRLSSCVRESDTVARLGGDEFTLILDDLDDLVCVDRIVVDILKKLAEPFRLNETLAYVSASIGITLYPKDGNDSDTLIKNADQAMYAAKNQGRNRYSYFTSSMHAAAVAKMQVASDLRQTSNSDQFKLSYQPIVDLSSGLVVKAEALLRWQHPVRGLVSPMEFIPVAEDIGIIDEIGDWVFFEAARDLANWRNHFNSELQISINKSPAQFHSNNNQHQTWIDHLQKLDLSANSIVLEITESLLLEANDSVGKQLRFFRDAGMQIALDDFGTGYSSLAYLKKFPIDYIKIDRSFVSHLSANSSDMALCEAIIVMAHKLEMKVIAEGIETEQQRDLLATAGCDFGQGFLFSKPITADELSQLLSRQLHNN